MSAIFLSYRRDDSSGYAGRLFDNLDQRFGRERVFMDIETLEPGMDFVDGIDQAIKSCGAVIVLIGPNWTRAEDSDGRRRLENPHDFIRLEITTAMKRGVRIIPVLVHGAVMPQEQELPEPLRPLCRLQACEIADNRWDFDVSRLGDVLEPLIAEPADGLAVTPPTETVPARPPDETPQTAPTPGGRSIGLAVLAALVVAAGGGAWWFSQSPPAEQVQPTSQLAPAPPADPIPAIEAVQREPEPTAVSIPSVSAEPEPAADASSGPARTAETQPVEVPAPDGEPVLTASPDPEPAADLEPGTASAPHEPSAEELQGQEIAELIHAAEIDLAETRLTRPAGNNAFERFQRVLQLDPRNPAAREGLIAISQRYQGLVEGALARGELDRAQRLLESARPVDAGADWLAPMAREIASRRQVAAPARAVPGPQPNDATAVQTCLSSCEIQHGACLADLSPQAEADCLQGFETTCEQRYQACMSDTSKMFMGQVSLESECAGVHSRCRASATEECSGAAGAAEAQCETQFETCTTRCK